MDLFDSEIIMSIGTLGLLAPLLFISFHLIRPILFLPVMLICISGGILFGTLAGTVYSIVGITLSSILFYGLIQKMPKTLNRLITLKQKLIGPHVQMTTPQIALLRLIPFIHFHLLSLCLIEMTASFKDYTKSSIVSNIPLAVVYTSLGQQLSHLTPLTIILLLMALIIGVYLFRKKEMAITWQEFFGASA